MGIGKCDSSRYPPPCTQITSTLHAMGSARVPFPAFKSARMTSISACRGCFLLNWKKVVKFSSESTSVFFLFQNSTRRMEPIREGREGGNLRLGPLLLLLQHPRKAGKSAAVQQQFESQTDVVVVVVLLCLCCCQSRSRGVFECEYCCAQPLLQPQL